MVPGLLLFLPWLGFVSEPIDTNQFGQIKLGMIEVEAVRRLGEPERIYEELRPFTKILTSRGTEIRERRRYIYYYPGNARIMDTLITFEGER